MKTNASAKILIIDDDENNLRAYTRLLRKRHRQIVTATSGEEGLRQLSKHDICLIMLDVNMPGMSGFETAERITSQEKTANIPIVFVTAAYISDDFIKRGFNLGAVDYVTKPVDPYILRSRVEVFLRLHEQQEELEKRNRSLRESEEALRDAHDKLEELFKELRRDYEIAQKVFSNVVHADHVESKHIKYFLSPMDIVGGDLFLSSTGASGSQYVFLGDFTGHGLSAAIGVIPASDIFYTMAGKGHSIEKIVAEINRKLRNVLPTGLFLCACFVELDYARGTLTVWNGGLPDALIIEREGGIKKRLPSLHLPLGVVSSEKLDTSVDVVELAQADFIYIYTDGVIEASNKDGEMFGQQRLEEHFTHIEDPDSLFDEIRSSVSAFCSGRAQDDDITMAEIRYDAEAVRPFDRKTIGEPEEVSTGWRWALELGPESLRTEEVLPHLMEMLMGAHKGLRDHKENIYLMVSELFCNALEWGVLGLDSKMKKDPEGFEEYYAARERGLEALEEGRIKIDLELFEQDKGGKLVVRVEDSGPGFDYQKALPQLSDNIAFGGRGIPLVRSLCRELIYQGRGNRVEAVYVWP